MTSSLWWTFSKSRNDFAKVLYNTPNLSKIAIISSIVVLNKSRASVFLLIISLILSALVSSSLLILITNSPSKDFILDKGSGFIFVYSLRLLFHFSCGKVKNSKTIGKVLKNLFSTKEFI